MADTYKVLAQKLTTDSVETLVYTAPALAQTSVSSIQILNSSSSSVTYDLSFIKANDVASSLVSNNFQKAISAFTIDAGEIHELKGGITLSPGDQVRVKATSASLIINMFGVEIV